MDKELFKKAKDILDSKKYIEDRKATVEDIKRHYNYGVTFGYDNISLGNFDKEDIEYFCDYLINKYDKELEKLNKQFEEL